MNNTRSLTVGKCNLWRAIVKEEFYRACFSGALVSLLPAFGVVLQSFTPKPDFLGFSLLE
jgi:hypothetical protein